MPQITYEITAVVEVSLQVQYEEYLRDQHIPDLLATNLFSGASLSKSETGSYSIRYEALSREALDRYLSEYAPALRKNSMDHFPEGVELSRTEWTVIETW
jgi:Domain of unknown function (DUF4286)